MAVLAAFLPYRLLCGLWVVRSPKIVEGGTPLMPRLAVRKYR